MSLIIDVTVSYCVLGTPNTGRKPCPNFASLSQNFSASVNSKRVENVAKVLKVG
jgi:hypothetical protein